MDAYPASTSTAPAPRGFARRSLTLLTGLAGITVLVGLIMYAGPARLAGQLHALGPLLPLLLVLTGVRYFLQAAGWCLAMTQVNRPGWAAFFNAVVVGEALGYVAWGPIAREPTKALFLRPRVPTRLALGAAVAERVIFVFTATVLAVVAVGLLAARRVLVWLATAGALAVVVVIAHRRWSARYAPRADRISPTTRFRQLVGARGSFVTDLWQHRHSSLLAIAGLAVGQEAINVLEAYVIFVWLGAAPSLTAAIVFEGLSRFVNAAGQFVPGRVGVYEGASALLADALSLGASHGVSLALARRARSLIWAVPGVLLLAHRGYDRAVGRENAVPAPPEVHA